MDNNKQEIDRRLRARRSQKVKREIKTELRPVRRLQPIGFEPCLLGGQGFAAESERS